MIRLDMSEFMEKHEVSKLIGALPATWDTKRRQAYGSGAQAPLFRGAF